MAGMLSVSPIQGQTVRGVISDRLTEETLPRANVVVDGTTTGTAADLQGRYELTLEPGTYTLAFSFLGYLTEYREVTLAIGQTLSIDVALSPDITIFDEIVVIGYGSQPKRVITGAIASVSSEEITSTPVLRVEQALQGRTAGVQVTHLSGQPGEAPTIRIRGAGTTGNAAPLFIVDGMEVGGIDFLNPGDIESIDVLKDAASAAIYGARAANGVVLITTRRGEKGPMRLTYSTYQGFQNAVRNVQMLDADQYRMLMNEGARNAGITEPFDLNEIPLHNTDWQDELFVRNAPMVNHDVSISGGSERSTYASSLSYFNQQGIIGGDRSQFTRLTARLNTTHQVNDWFNFGNIFAYTHIRTRGIASNASFNAAYGSALNMDPLTPVFETNENVLNTPPFSTQPVVRDSDGNIFAISEHVRGEVVNPLAMLEIQTGRTSVDKLVGNIYGEFEFIEGLKFRTTGGLDLAYVQNDGFEPLFYLSPTWLEIDRTSVNKGIDRWLTWDWQNTLTFSREIDGHNFTALAGISARKTSFENLFGSNSMVPTDDPDHVYLDMALDTLWQAWGGASQSALMSQFGRITYDFERRYALNVTLRRDGSSRFGPGNRFGVFPSVGLSWVISDEDFFPDLRAIDIVKLRGAWGVNGNEQIGDFMFLSTMRTAALGYIFGGGREIGAIPAFIENKDIHWEESEQLNFAIDFGAFNNRLTGSVDYYIKTTKGLLETIPIPGHVGNAPPVANVGSVENRGVELSLDWRHVGRDFSYSFGINGAYNRNRMTVIGNEEGILPGAGWAVAGMVTRTEVGKPIAYFWGYKTDGIFQNRAEVFQHVNRQGQLLQPIAVPGDVRFVDVNGDGVINADDRTMIGNPTPDVTFGFNGNIEFRQFDLGFLIAGTYGNEIFNGMQRRDLRFTNRTIHALDRWTGEGTSNTVPRYTWIDPNLNERVSDLYIEDGSFIRLRNIQIGYTIPRTVLNAIQAHTWRIFVSAENLFTLTNYTGADPEIGAISAFDIGIDRGVYPQARTWRVGTTISF